MTQPNFGVPPQDQARLAKLQEILPHIKAAQTNQYMGHVYGPQAFANAAISAPVTIILEGDVTYSHISRHFSDEELAERNAKSTYPRERTFTTLTLVNPQIVSQPSVEKDDNQLRAEAALVGAKFYKSTKTNEVCVAPENITHNIPALFVRDGNTNQYNEVAQPDAGEIRRGAHVMVQLRVYFSAPRNRYGVSLDAVFANNAADVTPLSGGVDIADLSALGIVVNRLPQGEQSAQPQVDMQLRQPQQQPTQQPQAQAQPAQQPVLPQGQTQQTQPAQQSAQQTQPPTQQPPVQQPQPQQESAFTDPWDTPPTAPGGIYYPS